MIVDLVVCTTSHTLFGTSGGRSLGDEVFCGLGEEQCNAALSIAMRGRLDVLMVPHS